MRTAETTLGLGELIQKDRVHGSLYYDPEIFKLELEKVWHRGGVYVGHESEIPNSGDYRAKRLGMQPVIMSRHEDGRVYLLLNRCPHRANPVCESQRGNSALFRCWYHGWTFSSNGDLLGVPYKGGYSDQDFRNEEMGLAKVPRVASYRGFVFGSLSPEGISLDQHLGRAKEAIDRLVSFSPEGEVELRAGWLRHLARANWKALMEQNVDGYHPQFVHKSLFSALSAGGRKYKEDINYAESKSLIHARYLGGGHADIEYTEEYQRTGEPFQWFGGVSASALGGYVAAMDRTYGHERARRILVNGPPHTLIFPNLFLAEMNLVVVHPLSVSESSMHIAPVLIKGAPEVNQRIIRRCAGAMGPAGGLIADDVEICERTQRGVQADLPEWIVLKRGLNREKLAPDGTVCSNLTDETPYRGMWQHYKEVMLQA